MTRLCRFNDHLLGVVDGAEVIDVSPALQELPAVRWPWPQSDLLMEHLDRLLPAIRECARHGSRQSLGDCRLLSPVANAPKVIGAPVNYLRHQAEALADGGVHFDKDVKTIAHYGLFLKASTSVVGPASGIPIRFPERRTDHELELVAVIGRGGRDIREAEALEHVVGYSLGLDMTIRGPEDRSLRKSLDGFSVLGPWLVTRDEIADPNDLLLTLMVNGEVRQRASTRDLIFNVQQLIAYASRFYTLCPGDLIYTGTPEGVGPVTAGDELVCKGDDIGEMRITVYADAVPSA
jgi:2,4-didehydro-3-deoxy-L-rhamnonate hydrolase